MLSYTSGSQTFSVARRKKNFRAPMPQQKCELNGPRWIFIAWLIFTLFLGFIIMHSFFWRLYFCKNTLIKYQV